ncbi:conjugative transfer signal peptidase TraF [Pseudomonas juntendi]|uniref:conjugative transfer signal peptidase TraF n=1 Tax=Pseudomonas juntendi TaxID=2666183 RepID=UPI003B933390
MSHKLRCAAGALLGITLLAGVVGGGVHAAGGRFNTSKSLALGLYWATSGPVEKGGYVMFCPPQTSLFSDARDRGYVASGFCPGNFGPLMKRVLAAKGDQVSITQQGVEVNGVMLPFSKPLLADGVGRPLPQLAGKTYVLGDQDLLLMTDASPTSFDARYFGIIHGTQVISPIRPVFTWQGE